MDTIDLLGVVAAHDYDADPSDFGAGRIDAIAGLDKVVRRAQAMQAQQIAALDKERSAGSHLNTGYDPSLSLIGELGMARNISPGAAGNQYGFAVGLARMPRTAAVFAAGGISESAARSVVRESIGLDGEQVSRLDQRIADRLPGLTARKAAALARYATIEIDADAALKRAMRNRKDRFVSLFPESDGVAVLKVRGPAEQLLAAYNALDLVAQQQRAAGDTRKVGQIMCDVFVERVTGTVKAQGTGVEIGLIMTAGTLLGNEGQPPILKGFGPISPELALAIIAQAQQSWIRRLFTDPVDGSLADCDQRRRQFTGKVKKIVLGRDLSCRQPGCGSKIRHIDHILAYMHGGPTIRDNGQGLCGRSHTLKHLPNWNITTRDGSIIWTTPTGHRYASPRPAVIEYARRGPGHQRQ